MGSTGAVQDSIPPVIPFLFNHIAFPPKLPHKPETDRGALQREFLGQIAYCAKVFQALVPFHGTEKWQSVVRALDLTFLIQRDEGVAAKELQDVLTTLRPGQGVFVYIEAQNAGVSIYHTDADSVVFEASELSAGSAATLASIGPLLWHFPLSGATIPSRLLQDERFVAELAGMMEKMSTEAIPQLAAKTAKANSLVRENRDVTEASLVTDMLMAILQAHGSATQLNRVRKHVRDDVCWRDGSETPWRRLPLWLFLKIGLQRFMYQTYGTDVGHAYYKFFLAFVHANLLESMTSTPGVAHDLLHFLQRKLGRRLQKLQDIVSARPSVTGYSLSAFLSAQGGHFRQLLESTSMMLESNWAGTRRLLTKNVATLEYRTSNECLRLRLFSSGPRLEAILSEQRPSRSRLEATFDCSARIRFRKNQIPLIQRVDHLVAADRIFYLADVEEWVETNLKSLLDQNRGDVSICARLQMLIQAYLSMAQVDYFHNVEQLGTMLLTVFEIWMGLDQFVLEMIPLLASYGPVFPSNLLDTLQLPLRKNMRRKFRIEQYLQSRHAKSEQTFEPIFGRLTPSSFAVKYFETSSDMQTALDSIQAFGTKVKAAKVLEWKRKSAEYDELSKRIAQMACLMKEHDVNPLLRVHDDQGCSKCFVQRQARKIKIGIHEFPLPEDPYSAKGVVFELQCPRAFSHWRDTTWEILTQLCYEHLPPTTKQSFTSIREYAPLKRWSSIGQFAITLGSRTKPFSDAHYSELRFPVDVEDVTRPSGLSLDLWDSVKGLWTRTLTAKPSLARHSLREIPHSSPLAFLISSPTFQPGQLGRTDNEIVAGQTRCPNKFSINEYMGVQDIRSGAQSRWLRLLRELAASNISLHSQVATASILHVAFEVGSQGPDEDLGTLHWMFADVNFGLRLLEQLRLRLDSISANWRESSVMEVIVELVLRVRELSDDVNTRKIAEEMIRAIRAVTFNWVRALRSQIYAASTADVSRKRVVDTFWAAILCRRTFSALIQEPWDMSSEEIECLVEIAIILKETMVHEGAMSREQKMAQTRDAKILHGIEGQLRDGIASHKSSVERAICNVWPGSLPDGRRHFETWKPQPAPNDRWVSTFTVPTVTSVKQRVDFNIIDGSLLVDGKPIGKLPDEFQNEQFFQYIFGDRSLLTFPSGEYGMTYQAVSLVEDHVIHLGHRGSQKVIRVQRSSSLLELIPGTCFTTGGPYDLPLPLVEGMVHFLDILHRRVEIRPLKTMWALNDDDWIIDLTTNRACRRRRQNNEWLVEPTSYAAASLIRTVSPFENAAHMIITQPDIGGLSIHLPRYELTFTMNKSGRLQCRQLNMAMVDLDQDIGTLYGLQSKLVLRDEDDAGTRTVLIPMNLPRLTYQPNHVHVSIEPSGEFCRFTVNAELGRLDCSIEPRYVYFKSLFHAYTSGFLPDPLMGRTGTEEAVECISESFAMPYRPLVEKDSEILSWLADLTPNREYYPRELKVMQEVYWKDAAPWWMQHDLFSPMVSRIRKKSVRLQPFFDNGSPMSEPTEHANKHLLRRARTRNDRYRPHSPWTTDLYVKNATSYEPYRQDCDGERKARVLEIVATILQKPARLKVEQDLLHKMGGYNNLTGFVLPFDKTLLNDHLNLKMADDFGPLVKLLSSTFGDQDKSSTAFFFSLLAFGREADFPMIRTLLAFHLSEEVHALALPYFETYTNFGHMKRVREDYLRQLLKSCQIPYPDDERTTCPAGLTMRRRNELAKLEATHKEAASVAVIAATKSLIGQWPCLEPVLVELSDSVLLSIEKVREVVLPEWASAYQNAQLEAYILKLQQALDHMYTDTTYGRSQERKLGASIPLPIPNRTRNVSLSDLFPFSARVEMPDDDRLSESPRQRLESLSRPSLAAPNTPDRASGVKELESLIARFEESDDGIRRKYASDLRSSLRTFVRVGPATYRSTIPSRHGANAQRAEARKRMVGMFDGARLSMQSALPFAWSRLGDMLPRITTCALLKNLANRAGTTRKDLATDFLVEYASMISDFQKWNRICLALHSGNLNLVKDELSNPGHSYWDVNTHIDWLLLEVEANIQIRPSQIDVARAIISPTSGNNSILQMMMGQGKSSCIIPMVAVKLANAKQLLRVVVPRALLFQTAQVLQQRLGGLLGRTITHVPFSRRTKTSEKSISEYRALHEATLRERGIIITLPEHLLSFKLSGLQALLDERVNEAGPMLDIQRWLSVTSRDVLDECDVSLAVRTQLIYPSGKQRMVDGHPNRWRIAEAVLHLTKRNVLAVQEAVPNGIEILVSRADSFPNIYFLRREAELKMVTCIVEDLLNGFGSILPVETLSQDDLLMIKSFLLEPRFTPEKVEPIMVRLRDKPAVKKDVLILRGLIVHRILLMSLQKRWNVQYGLHPERDPIAVPFDAKGVPSKQSEWGHPDVAILLTCLSFYYTGLSVAQLQESIGQIQRSDNPAAEYSLWLQNAKTVPTSLRQWEAINLDDELQTQQLWSHLRYNMVVVDHFLNNFVFPRHAKQFQRKLQASGWDIPLPQGSATTLPSGKENVNPSSSVLCQRPINGAPAITTGFSGTNDNRLMLPLNIKQDDLDQLSGTNAEVLLYLLEHRNRDYRQMVASNGKRLTETGFLALMTGYKIRANRLGIKVLIDAGAQILEMSNLEVARAWLREARGSPAAVYFSTDDDKPWVLHRDGKRQPLFGSPFAEDLSDCLVYLDEAHTRGTDLKLPRDAVGALTLGLGQTKDHTVQAAMRLRQLGTTQSVVFFAPIEVHQSICDHVDRPVHSKLNSQHVISWLIEQSCQGIELLQPLYIGQGTDFCIRTEASSKFPGHVSDITERRAFLKALELKEQFSLEDLYEPRQSKSQKPLSAFATATVRRYYKDLQVRRRNFLDRGQAVHGSALQEVEQEREIQIEVEAVRQVEIPVHARPHQHLPLNEELVHIVETGRVRKASIYLEQLFRAWSKTAIGRQFGLDSQSMNNQVYVTKDFSRTTTDSLPNDIYARAVQWILWAPQSQAAVIISPHEAEQLIPWLRKPDSTRSHLLTYAAPVTRNMVHFDSLSFYSYPPLPKDWVAPSWLAHEIGLFAGRLYFNFDTYETMRQYLGLQPLEIDEQDPTIYLAENNPTSDHTSSDHKESTKHELTASKRPFTERPLAFMQEWLAIRRKGQEFTHTPMGLICQGKRLAPDGAFKADDECQADEDGEGSYLHNEENADDSGNLSGETEYQEDPPSDDNSMLLAESTGGVPLDRQPRRTMHGNGLESGHVEDDDFEGDVNDSDSEL